MAYTNGCRGVRDGEEQDGRQLTMGLLLPPTSYLQLHGSTTTAAANNNTHLPIEPGKEGSTMPIDTLRERLIDGPHHCMKHLDALTGLEIAMGTCPLLIHWCATIALLSWHRVQQQHNNWSHIGKHRVESRSHWQKQSIPRKLCHSIHQRTMPYCSPAADTTTSYERPLSRSHGVQG